jgi:hypothetical protein
MADIIVLAAIELAIRTMKGERNTATMGLSEPATSL